MLMIHQLSSTTFSTTGSTTIKPPIPPPPPPVLEPPPPPSDVIGPLEESFPSGAEPVLAATPAPPTVPDIIELLL